MEKINPDENGNREKFESGQYREIWESISPELKYKDMDFFEEEREELDSEFFRRNQEYSEGDGELELRIIDLKKIISTVSLAHIRDGWNTEYQNRKGRLAGVASQLASGKESEYERIFHIQDPTKGVICVESDSYLGEYIVLDGSHRVSGCKLVELNQIPVFIQKK